MKTFTRSMRVWLAALAVGVVVLAQAAAAGDQDFRLVNKTGVEIYSVYVSPHNADDWQDDVLDEDTLADGDQVDITFSRKERTAMWDLRIEDEDGNALEWENLDLTEVSKVTLHSKKGKNWADVE